MPLVIIKSDRRAREKPCLRCGYSLRRIDSTHCPECGLSVWLSLNQNDALDWSRPEWLRRMSRGLWIMAAAQGLGLISFVLLAIVSIAATIGWGPLSLAWIVTAQVISLAYLIIYNAGLLLLTWSEERYPDRLETWRIASWIVAGVSAIFGLLLIPLAFVPLLGGMVQLAMDFLILATGIVTLGYLRRLARRIPNSTLARICGWMMLLPVIPFLKVFPFCGVYLLMRMLWLGEILPILYLPASAVLFIWFATLFRRAAASAEGSWASETALTR
jgi:hypothetical protein